MGLFGSVPSVSGGEAVAMVGDGAVLVDVREKAEWHGGHAPGAVHLPLSRIGEAPRTLRGDGPYVVVCRSGHRSKVAVRRLRKNGVEALNLSGGLPAWAAAGGRVVGDRS